MLTPQDILHTLPGGRILDVATGNGGFIHFLLEGLPAYSEIIGIDNNERSAAAFAQAFKEHPNIRFEPVDALQMSYPEASFDLVCISNSLHHFENPQAVLGQIKRVLRPGGHFILAEMYRDDQNDPQMTHVHLHHWWAAVDRSSGVVHNETSLRQELLGLIASLGLADLKVYDLADSEEDPKNPENLAQLNAVIDRYIQRAEGHPDLQARGEELRQRLSEIGFQGATTLIVVATNPA